MAGPINNHGGFGLNGSRAGSMTSGMEKGASDKSAADSGSGTAKTVTDEVSLSAAGKQLNAQEISGARVATAKLDTPEQAASVAKQIASAIRQDGAQAIAALGSGDVSGMKGLLVSA